MIFYASAKNGFKNIVTLDTYIYHHEHCSFLGQTNHLMEKGISAINRLYPDYQQLINVFNNNVVFSQCKKNIQTKAE